ncbi:MAG: YfjI family protein [Methylobacter sp.]
MTGHVSSLEEYLNETQTNHEKQQTLIEIQPLRRPHQPAEPFPLDALGIKLKAAVKAVQAAVKAPPAICAQSFLACAAVCVQGTANLELHGSTIPLSEFFLTIAESGERKTATDNHAKTPHNAWQKEEYKRYQDELKQFKDAYEAFEKARKEAINKGEPCPLPEPSAPRMPMLFSEDPTFEGIFKLLETGLPSIGIFSDEGGRMLGGYAMNAENRLKTVASLSKLWDGAPIDRVRAGDGSRILYGRRCSVHLMAQPGAAASFLNDGISADQGILSRFLMVHPDSTKGTRFYVDLDLRNDLALAAYQATVERLLRSWKWDIATGELELRTIELTPAACRLWIAYHDHIEGQQTADGAYRSITAFASKAAEHAARLAAIIQLFDEPDANQVNDDYMQCGIKLMDFYLIETIRLKQLAVENQDLILAEKLLEWFKSEGLTQIYPVKVYHDGPGAVRNKAKALPLLKILEDHGYLTPIAPDQALEIDGKIRKQAWRINAYAPDEVLP